ncbi:hypothetical protein ACFXPT_39365, partial [Streptomyces goshikiensis]|uniref:hypothetical protein n=1 Tax=Streptomyces goshikiensis TaxID=1942 RepID=UPI0036A520CF
MEVFGVGRVQQRAVGCPFEYCLIQGSGLAGGRFAEQEGKHRRSAPDGAGQVVAQPVVVLAYQVGGQPASVLSCAGHRVCGLLLEVARCTPGAVGSASRTVGTLVAAASPRACPQCRLVVTPFVVRRHVLADQAWEVIGP